MGGGVGFVLDKTRKDEEPSRGGGCDFIVKYPWELPGCRRRILRRAKPKVS